MASKKHPQFVLAVSSYFFRGESYNHHGLTLLPGGIQSFFDEIQDQTVIAERDMLENSLAYRQLIPYLILRQRDEHGVLRYLCYRRTDKVGENQLANKVSVGFGGHIDFADIRHSNSVVDLFSTVIYTSAREFAEELKILDVNDPDNINELPIIKFSDFILLDDSEKVGLVHVGVVMFMDLPASAVFTCAEEELEMLPPMTAAELLATLDGEENTILPLEGWTKLFLECDLINHN